MRTLFKIPFYLYEKFFLYFAKSPAKSRFYRKYYSMKLGENIRYTGKPNWGSEPFLIEIGNNVTITQNISFITHDGGVGIFRKEHPGINIFGKIIVGDNVFIGSNVIFLPNVKVGNNVVIGAGSLVNKDIPNNVVAAGVPAKPIKSILDYKKQSLKNATFVLEKNRKNRKKIIIDSINNKQSRL